MSLVVLTLLTAADLNDFSHISDAINITKLTINIYAQCLMCSSQMSRHNKGLGVVGTITEY